jgi:hypothetical protein
VTGPRRPAHFTAAQKLICRAGARTLDATGVLTKVDDWPLEWYVVMFCRWRECEAFIAANEQTYAIRNDDPGSYVGRPADRSVSDRLAFSPLSSTGTRRASARPGCECGPCGGYADSCGGGRGG